MLPRYGDAMAALADQPVRRGANALWCSWYPIRMGINEEVVFEHAAIAAKHFKPLGMDVIQLDHGWQRGDICGDWVGNERFPHGMKWLADELRSRYGMKLGLWIAPTEVAETSEFFKEHRDWLYKDADGKLHGTWKWFWAPNPQMYMLDGSHPEAAKWVEETFARLSAEGACYYKIDFLNGGRRAATTPSACPAGASIAGWSSRSAAAPARTPGSATPRPQPLSVVGLANSSHMSPDTGDAGYKATIGINSPTAGRQLLGQRPDLPARRLRQQRRHEGRPRRSAAAAGHDGARRMQHVLQRRLPAPGALADPHDAAMPAARRTDDDAVGPVPARLPVAVADSLQDGRGRVGRRRRVQLHRAARQGRRWTSPRWARRPRRPVAVFEFWQSKLLGVIPDRLTLDMAPMTSRVLLVRPVAEHPQVIGTDMHVLGGYHELTSVAWDAATGELRRRVPPGAGPGGQGVRSRAGRLPPQGRRADFTQGGRQRLGEDDPSSPNRKRNGPCGSSAEVMGGVRLACDEVATET